MHKISQSIVEIIFLTFMELKQPFKTQFLNALEKVEVNL